MLKKIINNILKMFDAKIIRFSNSLPLDFTKKNFHPRTLSLINKEKPFLVNLEIKIGRTNRFYSLENGSFDPYIFSINHALKRNLKENDLYNSIILNLNYYKKIINLNNINELFDINDKSLNKFPAWSAVMPWEKISIDRAKHGFFIQSIDPNEIMREDQENSLPSHVKQYISLISKIQKEDYIPELKNSYIEVELLVKNDKYCWKPSGEGNHRATVLACLGYKKIKLLVTNIIRFEEAEYWPNVVNGCYERKNAEIIFNRFFEVKPPSYNNDWNRYCQEIISRDG